MKKAKAKPPWTPKKLAALEIQIRRLVERRLVTGEMALNNGWAARREGEDCGCLLDALVYPISNRSAYDPAPFGLSCYDAYELENGYMMPGLGNHTFSPLRAIGARIRHDYYDNTEVSDEKTSAS